MGGALERVWEKRNAYRVLVGKREENGPHEKCIDGRIILKFVLEKQDGEL